METIDVVVLHSNIFVVCKLVGYRLTRIMGDDGHHTRVIIPRSAVGLLGYFHLLANQNAIV